MSNLQDFAQPVHKSLQQPNLLMGVPKMVALVIICIAIIFAYLLGLIYGLVGVVLYVPCYFITKEDPQMLSIALASLTEPENLEG